MNDVTIGAAGRSMEADQRFASWLEGHAAD